MKIEDLSHVSESVKQRNPNLFGCDSNADLLNAYRTTGSVHKAGKILGFSGETVRRKLLEIGVSRNHPSFSEEEDEVIRKFYTERKGLPLDLNELANLLNRSRWSVAMRASRLGVCNPFRPNSEETNRKVSRQNKGRPSAFKGRPQSAAARENMSKAQQLYWQEHPEKRGVRSEKAKAWHKNNIHPRGMLGKHHSEETKSRLSESHIGKKVPRERLLRSMQTRLAKYGTLNPPDYRNGASWKSGWVEVGGKRFYARSRWESNYARYLEFLKQAKEVQDWNYEPKTFWFDKVKRGTVSYLPDFEVILWTGETEYHEVKGWMDARSKTKIKRMAKYYPQIKLVVIDAARYRALNRKCKRLIKDWA